MRPCCAFPLVKDTGGGGGHVAMSEWLHSGFPGFLPILPPFFGLMELCWEVYPGGRNRLKKWGGWLLRGRRESEAEASGEAPAAHHSYFSSLHPLASLGRGWGETASALKDASHALGGLMEREHVLERGWVSSGKRSFFA